MARCCNSVSVLSLNINTGHGPFKSFHERLERKELEENLDKIASFLRKAKPEVVCLQEVDLCWDGTHCINQASYIAEKAGYNYYVYHIFHKKIGVPSFINSPTISSIFNRDTGMAILSIYPITAHGYYKFGSSKNKAVDWLKNIMNEAKGYMWADIDKQGVIYTVINLHLINDIVGTVIGFLTGKFIYKGGKIREKQLTTLLRHLDEFFGKKNVIIAGDFNSVPESLQGCFSNNIHGLEEDDYRGDSTLEILKSYAERTKRFLLLPFISCRKIDEARDYFTYPAIKPQRPIDYIFPPYAKSYCVLKELLSDHLPVFSEAEVLS